ncbi:Hypothetical predicted protein [Cloeon dipterum]|uniref:Gamma-glutamylcyclotransferase family protein n=1 Tax=Cloeon dipterum TaxID=197152 RepID=A0A8S1DBA7_9INSE|nr:Hypothetical predicted protein [Cloeon dipterum]
MESVFVYGTLKKGEPNHDWMTEWKEGQYNFIGRAKTVEKLPLIISSRYNIPFLLDKPGFGQEVHGEVYEVDAAMVKRLDELEDHPIFYKRELRPVRLECGTERVCWIYLIQKYREDLLELPFLDDYKSNGPHGLVYGERSSRTIPGYSAMDDIQGNQKY